MNQSIVIPDWHPATLNSLLGKHWGARAKAKKADYAIVAGCAFQSGTVKATGKRRLTVTLTLAPRQRAGDPDAYFKSLLDALVHAGLLVDDNRQGVELTPLKFERGKRRQTVIQLEDVPE